jgi:hypothetical protein
MTRHQSHHTGTIEETDHAVRAALANQLSKILSYHSNGDSHFENDFVTGISSPAVSTVSLSPGSSLLLLSHMYRQENNFAYIGDSSIPSYLR